VVRKRRRLGWQQMNTNNHDRRTTIPEWLYEVLVALYPKHFRQEYGPAMRQVLREMLDDSEVGGWRLGMRILADVARSLQPEYLAILRSRAAEAGNARYGFVLGSLSCVVIVTTNVVYPRFDYFGLDENIAMLLSVALLLLFFAATGFRASRTAQRVVAGTRVGALTALVGMGIAMLTFTAVDNLFLDIVSQQPEKVWGFQHSQASSMRAYINLGHLRGAIVVLPLLVLVGAVCGTLGAALQTLTRRFVQAHD
jgi:hypothetical protein